MEVSSRDSFLSQISGLDEDERLYRAEVVRELDKFKKNAEATRKKLCQMTEGRGSAAVGNLKDELAQIDEAEARFLAEVEAAQQHFVCALDVERDRLRHLISSCGSN